MVKKQSDPVAKRLRTGEIAVWDSENKAIILLPPLSKEVIQSARVIRGSSFKALQEALGDVVVLA